AWLKVDLLEQRTRFVMQASAVGIPMAQLCRQFGISRKTGYKWRQRFREQGLDGLRERTRRPHKYRQPLDAAWARRIVQLRQAHPHWGAKKLHRILQQRQRGGRAVPACSTIGVILRREG